ncbi:MAG: hypothetical protein QOG73_3795 [Acetobacteraceae bacterium]|jgi:hypothetical protein|nr:hypothetical protein [Acetobacteraceae bacterium]
MLHRLRLGLFACHDKNWYPWLDVALSKSSEANALHSVTITAN